MKILIWIGLPLCFISAASSSCERCDPNATCEFDECVCMEGFVGNGTKCIKEEAECKSKCPPKTKCVNGTCVKTGSNMVGNCKHCPDNSSCVNGECQCKCGFKQEGDKCLDTDTVCKRCPELSSCENVMPNCTCNNESTLDGTCCVRDVPSNLIDMTTEKDITNPGERIVRGPFASNDLRENKTLTNDTQGETENLQPDTSSTGIASLNQSSHMFSNDKSNFSNFNESRSKDKTKSGNFSITKNITSAMAGTSHNYLNATNTNTATDKHNYTSDNLPLLNQPEPTHNGSVTPNVKYRVHNASHLKTDDVVPKDTSSHMSNGTITEEDFTISVGESYHKNASGSNKFTNASKSREIKGTGAEKEPPGKKKLPTIHHPPAPSSLSFVTKRNISDFVLPKSAQNPLAAGGLFSNMAIPEQDPNLPHLEVGQVEVVNESAHYYNPEVPNMLPVNPNEVVVNKHIIDFKGPTGSDAIDRFDPKETNGTMDIDGSIYQLPSQIMDYPKPNHTAAHNLKHEEMFHPSSVFSNPHPDNPSVLLFQSLPHARANISQKVRSTEWQSSEKQARIIKT